MKKFLAAMVAMTLCLGVAGCGGSEPAAESQPTQEAGKPGSESKAYALLSTLENGIYMDVISHMEESKGTELIFAVDGENGRAYMEAVEDGQEMAFVMNADGVYMLIPEEKVYMNFDINLFESDDMPILDVTELPEVTFTTGTEEIMGTEYEYEEFEASDGVERYYFEGDALKYTKSITKKHKENLMEVVEVRGSVEASLFEIPADYTEFSLKSLFSGN